MLRSILIAGLLIPHSTFAMSEPGGGEARLKKLLTCETSMMARLGQDHQGLLLRLQKLFNKFESVRRTVPDWVEKNMTMSRAVFFAEMNSLARQILDTPQPRPAAALNEILTSLEAQMSRALSPPGPPFNTGGQVAIDTPMFGEIGGMPIGPHDFNKATPKVAEQPPVYRFEAPGRFNPSWPPREKP